MFSRTVETNNKIYQELEGNFKEEYQLAKKAMAVDGGAATRKADNLEETEAKRQRQSEEEAAASAAA